MSLVYNALSNAATAACYSFTKRVRVFNIEYSFKCTANQSNCWLFKRKTDTIRLWKSNPGLQFEPPTSLPLDHRATDCLLYQMNTLYVIISYFQRTSHIQGGNNNSVRQTILCRMLAYWIVHWALYTIDSYWMNILCLNYIVCNIFIGFDQIYLTKSCVFQEINKERRKDETWMTPNIEKSEKLPNMKTFSIEVKGNFHMV